MDAVNNPYFRFSVNAKLNMNILFFSTRLFFPLAGLNKKKREKDTDGCKHHSLIIRFCIMTIFATDFQRKNSAFLKKIDK